MNVFFEGPQGVALKSLAKTLWSHGYKVYLAGGCVRDHLLGRAYKDLDVVTDASVSEIQRLFEKTIPVGVQFGIVRVLINNFEFEVARFRRDGPYVDGRHPEFIEFAGPGEDAQRRDFTINALFYDLQTSQILDFVDGKKDLKSRLLRAVGVPQKRFEEDYLRILRLIRFSCQLKFQMEPQTELAASALVSQLVRVSGERISVELAKALQADPKRALMILQKWKVIGVLFPEWGGEPSMSSTDSVVCDCDSNTGKYNKNINSDIGNVNIIMKDNGADSGLNSVGGALGLLLIYFQKKISHESIEVHSPSEWKYSKIYLQRASEIVRLLKISKRDEKNLKLVGSIFSWQRCWNQLRPGFRASLSQSDEFLQMLSAACQLHAWDEAMVKEVSTWLAKPKVQPYLQGFDLNLLPPSKRGLALRESLYLQYEGILSNREQALKWLKTQLAK